MKQRLPYYPKAQNISSLITKISKSCLKNGGYYFATIMLDWDKIIGTDLSHNTMPFHLSFPRNQGTGATLTIQVNPAFALTVGFQKGLIIEKIATFFGKRLVEEILFKQSPITRTTPPIQQPKKTKDTHLPQIILDQINTIQNNSLKKALICLGEGIINQ